MGKIEIDDVIGYVENNIGNFHTKRLASLQRLKLRNVLKRKNPYLFKAKNILSAGELVKTLTDAFLSSQEETLFGDFLEELAVFIAGKVRNAWKSSAEGIDLEFDLKKTRYIIAIKSGPNWGNSSQVRKMKEDFKRAKKILRKTNSSLNITAVNGCCYGRDRRPDKGDYFKYCGEVFWEFISENPELYVQLIEPLGHKAKEKNEEFLKDYWKLLNKFTVEFVQDFCTDGQINWETLVRFNSSKN